MTEESKTAIKQNQVSAAKVASVTGGSALAAQFVVDWMRDAGLAWLWPSSNDWMAIVLLTMLFGYLSRTYGHWRRTAGKPVIPGTKW